MGPERASQLARRAASCSAASFSAKLLSSFVVFKMEPFFVGKPMVALVYSSFVGRPKQPDSARETSSDVYFGNEVPPGSDPSSDPLNSKIGRRQLKEMKRDLVSIASPGFNSLQVHARRKRGLKSQVGMLLFQGCKPAEHLLGGSHRIFKLGAFELDFVDIQNRAAG
jgi:hypothetical protein